MPIKYIGRSIPEKFRKTSQKVMCQLKSIFYKQLQFVQIALYILAGTNSYWISLYISHTE